MTSQKQNFDTDDEIYHQRLKEYLDAQIEEVYKYKWIMGEEMHRDPLDEFSLNDIFFMWIESYAKSFREKWIQDHGSGYFNGIDNTCN